MQPSIIGEEMHLFLTRHFCQMLGHLLKNRALAATPTAKKTNDVDRIGLAYDVRYSSRNPTMRAEEVRF